MAQRRPVCMQSQAALAPPPSSASSESGAGGLGNAWPESWLLAAPASQIWPQEFCLQGEPAGKAPLHISSRSNGRACGAPTVFLDPGPPELLQRCSGNLSPECSPVRGGLVVGQQQLGSGSPGELSPVSAAHLTTLKSFTWQILSAYMSQASACRSPDRRTKPGGTGCDQGGSGRKAWNKLGEPRCREEVLRGGGTAASMDCSACG